MSARAPVRDPSAAEREIHERAAAAKIRLRFDKSVQRLLDDVKTALADAIPDGQAIIFAVTAPIRRRAKTAIAIEALVRAGLTATGGVCSTIEDNRVRIRRVRKVPAGKPKVLGFVHNPESDADALLTLAEAHLLGRG
ncbi:hypothetical protein [Dongia sp.]|uniref:hypothetical protein n=1 Tax=Dongia sp. TaxID=1977262 RepID=UPI00374FE618